MDLGKTSILEVSFRLNVLRERCFTFVLISNVFEHVRMLIYQVNVMGIRLFAQKVSLGVLQW